MNAGECVRRLFFVIFAPDSQQESSPLSGRKSTQATVRICGASSPYSGTYLGYDGLRHPCP
ncbi:BA14K family protein [Bradyrhizobium liaoningense]